MFDPLSAARRARQAPPSRIPALVQRGDEGAERWWKRVLRSSSETLTHKDDITTKLSTLVIRIYFPIVHFRSLDHCYYCCLLTFRPLFLWEVPGDEMQTQTELRGHRPVGSCSRA